MSCSCKGRSHVCVQLKGFLRHGPMRVERVEALDPLRACKAVKEYLDRYSSAQHAPLIRMLRAAIDAAEEQSPPCECILCRAPATN